MRRVTATESPALPIPSPRVPMSCKRKSEYGAKTTPDGTPPAEVERNTSESVRWQLEHWRAVELKRARPRSWVDPAVIAIGVGGARCAMKNVKFATSSCSSLRPPEQLLLSAAKSSSVPGIRSSGQPLMTALVGERFARFSVANARLGAPRMQADGAMPISFRDASAENCPRSGPPPFQPNGP